MNARIGVIVLCALALVACSSIPPKTTHETTDTQTTTPQEAPGWVVVDDDVGPSAPPRDSERARHITRLDIIIGALFGVAVYWVTHAREYPAAKCQHDGQQNCRR